MNGTRDPNALAYKVVLLGDVSVGKTFIAHRFVKGTVPKSPNPTIGVEFSTRTETLNDGTIVKAQIWDTAGQERYRSITSAKAVGALLVFDLTKEKTFLSVSRWAEELRYHAGSDVKVLLVGNKLDEIKKDETRRAVKYSDASAYAIKNGMLYIEVSALDGDNIKEAFVTLLQEIHKSASLRMPEASRGGLVSAYTGQQGQSTGCSC